ncbi:MAG: hypothetical protein KIT62_11695 [Cyclobacteriaceae bacterium]|nr:hypothetical protein [Cyclobacteriaceae bacterium]
MAGVIRFWRKGLMARVIAGLVALYLFDTSVDFQHVRSIEEDITINEIESLSELLLEELINLEGLFDEVPESDREPISKVSFALIYLVPPGLCMQSVAPAKRPVYLVTQEQDCYSAPFIRLTPPPRQA